WDLPPIAAVNSAATAALTLKDLQDRPKTKIFAALFKVHAITWFLGAPCDSLSPVLACAVPILIAKIVENSDQNQGSELVVAMSVCVLSRLFFRQIAAQLHRDVQYRIKAALIGAIFEKPFRLSGSSAKEYKDGRILLMIHVDVPAIIRIVLNIHKSLTIPFQIIGMLALLYSLIGLAIVLAVATVILGLTCQSPLIHCSSPSQKVMLEHSDKRLNLIKEYFQAIKIIKLRGAEEPFRSIIDGARRLQLKSLAIYNIFIGAVFAILCIVEQGIFAELNAQKRGIFANLAKDVKFETVDNFKKVTEFGPTAIEERQMSKVEELVLSQKIERVELLKFQFYCADWPKIYCLSNDVQEIDMNLRWVFLNVYYLGAGAVCSLVIMVILSPYMLILIAVVIILNIHAIQLYRSNFRELKRISVTQASPVSGFISETLSGLATIRTFQGASECAIARQRVLLDASLVAANNTKEALMGAALTSSWQISVTITQLVFMFGMLDLGMVSIERLTHYVTSLTYEKAARCNGDPINEDVWPTRGEITFENLVVKYESREEPIIRGLSLTICAGDKSGKSSLLGCLFRIVETSGGKILIDGRDIGMLGLDTLRARLQIIPQEPVMFSGTIRSNLDYNHEFQDADIWEALQVVGLTEQPGD
ncbi:hypothetical protein HK100_001055, partial [Physocladia obscura]